MLGAGTLLTAAQRKPCSKEKNTQLVEYQLWLPYIKDPGLNHSHLHITRIQEKMLGKLILHPGGWMPLGKASTRLDFEISSVEGLCVSSVTAMSLNIQNWQYCAICRTERAISIGRRNVPSFVFHV